MAKLYKRGTTWWCWGYDVKGIKWTRSTRQHDKRAAAVAATEIERSLTLDAHRSEDRHTLGEALEVMIEHARLAERSPSTMEFLTTKARHVARLMGKGMLCSEIEPKHSHKFMHQRLKEGAHPHTVQKEIRILVQALRRAIKLGEYKPAIDPRLLRPDELAGAYDPRDRWLGVDDYERYLREFAPDRTYHARSQDRRDYITVWTLTGVRESELYGVKPQDVDLEAAVWHVAGTKTKSTSRKAIASAKRTIPIPPVVVEIFRRRLKLPKPFPRWATCTRDMFAACLRIEQELNPELDIVRGVHGADGELAARHHNRVTSKRDRVPPPKPFDPVTPNDLRRTYASWLAQQGVPLHTAAKLMGHGSTQMLERVYARLAPETLRDAVAKLPFQVTGAEPPLPPAAPSALASGRVRKGRRGQWPDKARPNNVVVLDEHREGMRKHGRTAE